jgi:hypothetical protein
MKHEYLLQNFWEFGSISRDIQEIIRLLMKHEYLLENFLRIW